jgi:predicted AAA+ superfamily ATPase
MEFIRRDIDYLEIQRRIENFSVTAILGPRQCGKTTLARTFNADHYFDLENPRDAARLAHPQLTLENLEGLIAIDEIQRAPELFPLLRHLVDTSANQKYLILGSASQDLIRQSSESLAGRIAYFQLGGFRLHDIRPSAFRDLWLRGGLPRSFLADADQSLLWRENYITTFLEKDIPQLGIQIPSATLRRFWLMLSHYHGQVLNFSELARAFGISDMTVRRYIEILEGTFMIRTLQPWHANIGKRLVKRPKLYMRDSGLLHSFLNVETLAQLQAHPKIGASWEGFALECTLKSIGKNENDCYFWKVHSGSEIDLLWQHSGKTYGIEFKYADAPRTTRSMTIAMQDLQLEHLWVVYPGDSRYRLDPKITVWPLQEIAAHWQYPS